VIQGLPTASKLSPAQSIRPIVQHDRKSDGKFWQGKIPMLPNARCHDDPVGLHVVLIAIAPDNTPNCIVVRFDKSVSMLPNLKALIMHGSI
jgi:hypothetical protein